MSARSIASGTVSFGLVTIPVKLYSTGEPAAGIHFNMVHAACGTPVKQRYFCPTDEAYVERGELAKGYEYAKGQYVLFSEPELKALMPEPTNAIEIAEFVPLEAVDPVFFDRAYYLGPEKGGTRPYRLLAAAMERSGQAALARYRARGKDYLVLVRPYQGGLLMQQLRYADEVRPFAEVPIGEAEIRDAELDLALRLIEQIATGRFAPEAYRDEARERVRALIDQKIEGQEIREAPAEAPKAQIIDLMEALKASLGSAAPARKPPKRSAAGAAKSAKAEAKKAAVTPLRKAARGRR